MSMQPQPGFLQPYMTMAEMDSTNQYNREEEIARALRQLAYRLEFHNEEKAYASQKTPANASIRETHEAIPREPALRSRDHSVRNGWNTGYQPDGELYHRVPRNGKPYHFPRTLRRNHTDNLVSPPRKRRNLGHIKTGPQPSNLKTAPYKTGTMSIEERIQELEMKVWRRRRLLIVLVCVCSCFVIGSYGMSIASLIAPSCKDSGNVCEGRAFTYAPRDLVPNIQKD